MIQVVCPSCRERKVERARPTFPFCSERCRDTDLSAWVEERYRVEGPPASPEDLPPPSES